MRAEPPALLLIGHGSRSPAGVAEYWALVDAVGGQDGSVPLVGGFIELARPDLDSAVDEVVAAGARSVVAVPLVLLGAGHMKDDGPALLARSRERHVGVRFLYARALGVHPLVLAVASDRVREAVGGGAPGRTAVVLVGRGSSDPDANADLYKVGRLLQDLTGIGDVEPAFVSLAPPSVPAALDRCRRLGATQVAVVPYFLFTGVLVDRIGDQVREWTKHNRGVEVSLGRHLGPDPRLARLVWERYGEGRNGQARMNCDGCFHRLPTPRH